ncbi:MAG: FadR/GntR family transcriptional regulator [Candidatus Desulfatibia sp.]|uniref:FadR/GntR family transcriptional regulator n=1 Tax=Candidatus Desulfatibia sp. TaxID=3101189 RepID=UPI002F309AFB
MFKPIKKTRIYEKIVDEIKDLINQGRLKGGDQLPTERKLSETFKVSRTCVREAFRILESQGLLESRPGNGTYIANNTIDSLIQPLASFILKEKDYQIELFEMRRLLESQLAYLAAERATPENMTKMEKILRRQAEQIANGETGLDSDSDFHHALAEATNNRILLHIIDTIIEFLAESRESYLLGEERAKKSLAHHKKIFSAIKKGDGELAAQAMREHIEDVEKTLVDT